MNNKDGLGEFLQTFKDLECMSDALCRKSTECGMLAAWGFPQCMGNYDETVQALVRVMRTTYEIHQNINNAVEVMIAILEHNKSK